MIHPPEIALNLRAVYSFSKIVLPAAWILVIMLVTPAGAQTVQDRENIGVGAVSSGLGSGPLPGRYDVHIEIWSHKRYAHYVNDGGEKERYCRVPDLHPSVCWDFSKIDGIKLRKRDIQGVSGHLPWSRLAWTLEGSLASRNFSSSPKWEWPKESHMDKCWPDSDCRLTNRNIKIADLRFTVPWTGARLQSMVRVRWFESDPVGKDDLAEWAYFNTGDMMTRCLQGGSVGQSRTILAPSSDFFWHLCSEDGVCFPFSPWAMLGSHYNIATFYHVNCDWWPETACGDGLCQPGEACAPDCNPVPPPSCGDGTCQVFAGETTSNCPQDCSTNPP